VVIVSLAVASSCARHGLEKTGPAPDALARYPGPRIDNVLFAKTPVHRIGGDARRMILLGRGERSEGNIRGLKEFLDGTGRVEAIVPDGEDAGEMWNAMLRDPAAAGASERFTRFRADHLLLLDSSVTPYDRYVHGGTATFRVEAKIVELPGGTVVWETARSHGITYPPPSDYGMPDAHVPEITTEWISILNLMGMSEIAYELAYALGGTRDGTVHYSGLEHRYAVASVLKGSPADLAGIGPGDIIVGIGSAEVRDAASYRKVRVPQGSTQSYRIRRGGTEMEVRVSFPTIQTR